MPESPTVVRIEGPAEALDIDLPDQYADFYVLSPYVSRVASGYEMLVRLVNRAEDASKKVSQIHSGRSVDGRRFAIDDVSSLAPGDRGTDDDRGCEDPTVVRDGGARYVVFYSGYGGLRKRSTMLVATGQELHRRLTKRGLAFDDPEFENPKEAAFIWTPAGPRMFFEYAVHGASRIGDARALSLDGPWRLSTSFVPARPGYFDAWHLSPASAVRLTDGTHVLFYNGSTKDTVWRIGWAHVSSDATVLLDRCDEPLVGTFDLREGDSDIAFAASSVVESPGEVTLYYSISDRRLLRQRLYVANAIADSANPTR